MRNAGGFFGSALFFVPFAYIALYLWLERRFARGSPAMFGVLKAFTVLAGLTMLFSALTAPMDFAVPVPSGGTARNSIPAPVFLVVVGAALMALPWYGKYLVFSRKD